MLDINFLRVEKGGQPDIVRQSERSRGRSGSIVDKVLAYDAQWISAQYNVDQAKKHANAAAKEIGKMMKAGASAADLEKAKAVANEAKKAVPAAEAAAAALLAQRDALLMKIGNIVHSSVVVSNDEANNKVLRTWGSVDSSKVYDKSVRGQLAHYEILEALDGYEMNKANNVAGHRAYYLKGYGAMLNQALLQCAQAFLRKRGYTTIQTPYFMKRSYMAKAAELADFGETLYCIPADKSTDVEDKTKLAAEDLFLIATSEQPLCCLHANEYVEPKEVPIKYAGLSTCFRKEAGSHGKDMRGIFRVHQFEKVEQFVICEPSASWDMHEDMIATSEEFYQMLNLPYRVVSIVAGALNDAAARKYDLEAWFPSYGDYRELVSCSNCTDYQARALNIRLGAPKLGEREKQMVHMLNGTLCATERTMCCLLEHWQKEDGVEVPPPLVPYMDGLTFLPFRH